jgi:hypothetical protein
MKAFRNLEPVTVDRRHMLGYLAGTAGSCLLMPAVGLAQSPDAAAIRGRINTRLDAAVNNPDLVETARAARDQSMAPITGSLGTGSKDRRPPSRRLISDLALKAIVAFEVSSEQQYTKRYQGAIVPGEASGVTIGIGYDIGQIEAEFANFFKDDWKDYLPDDVIERLSKACGKVQADARQVRQSLLDIKVPWSVAYDQFLKRTLPLYTADVEGVFKNTDQLKPDSLGALVSLVYNRGTSFSGDRRREMLAIRDLMEMKNFSQIPDQFRSMKRLWSADTAPGLLSRRDQEADLFELGLTQTS